MSKNDFKLDFAVVGPMKTGTTWLYSYLKFHNQVRVPVKLKRLSISQGTIRRD